MKKQNFVSLVLFIIMLMSVCFSLTILSSASYYDGDPTDPYVPSITRAATTRTAEASTTRPYHSQTAHISVDPTDPLEPITAAPTTAAHTTRRAEASTTRPYHSQTAHISVETTTGIGFTVINDSMYIKIRNNVGERTINYGDGLLLKASVSESYHGYYELAWFINGKMQGKGETFLFSDAKTDALITVKLVDRNGKALSDYNNDEISDTIVVKVKNDLFRRIISFFKNLFKSSRIYTQNITF